MFEDFLKIEKMDIVCKCNLNENSLREHLKWEREWESVRKLAIPEKEGNPYVREWNS
jgi:hypothetical protein